jgi:hypothetical protein
MLISHNKGCYSPKLTFTFKFCNNSSDDSINLLPGKKTWGKIGANKVFELDEITIKPKACRQEKVTQQYNICQESFKASMNFSARSHPTGEYCWSYTKYEEKVNKTSDPPSVSPSITPSSSDLSLSKGDSYEASSIVNGGILPNQNSHSNSGVLGIIMGTFCVIAGAVLCVAFLLHRKRSNKVDEPSPTFSSVLSNNIITKALSKGNGSEERSISDNSPDLETSSQSWFPTLSFWNTQRYFTESTVDEMHA